MYFLDNEEIYTFLIKWTWKEETEDEEREGPIHLSQY